MEQDRALVQCFGFIEEQIQVHAHLAAKAVAVRAHALWVVEGPCPVFMRVESREWCRCWDDSAPRQRAPHAESSSAWGSAASSSGKNLSATRRPSFVSSAR